MLWCLLLVLASGAPLGRVPAFGPMGSTAVASFFLFRIGYVAPGTMPRHCYYPAYGQGNFLRIPRVVELQVADCTSDRSLGFLPQSSLCKNSELGKGGPGTFAFPPKCNVPTRFSGACSSASRGKVMQHKQRRGCDQTCTVNDPLRTPLGKGRINTPQSPKPKSCQLVSSKQNN